MVAYSFQQQFVAPIQDGRKCGTIRKIGGKRHARPGETIQLYTDLRTKYALCFGLCDCQAINRVALDLDFGRVEFIDTGTAITTGPELDHFAAADGFANWRELVAFWAKHHAGTRVFVGIQIRWHNFRRKL